MTAPTPQRESILYQALPGLVVAIATTGLTIGATLIGFVWRQTITLAEISKTLTSVCQEIEENSTRDRQQDEAIAGLRVDLEKLRKR